MCNVSSSSCFSSSFVSSISLLESIDEEDDDDEEYTSPILSFSNINCSDKRFGKLDEGAVADVEGMGGGSTSLAAPKLLLLLNILAGLNLDALSHVLDRNLFRKLLLFEFGDGVFDCVGDGGGGDKVELVELLLFFIIDSRSRILYEFDTLYRCCGLYVND